MTPKRSCGCDGAPNPAAEEDVVWHDPTRYDPILHGPPYMPTRLGTDAKGVSRRVASSKIHPKIARRLMGGAAPLSAVLSILRSASFLHQTHHWQTQGPSYYADHLLFDRLYNDSQAFIDQVGEKTVGLGQTELVDAVAQAQQVAQIIGVLAKSASGPNQLVETSLRMEALVLAVIDEAIGILRNSDSLTAGVDNLLQGVADQHETFVYLLQQRAATFYDYGR